MTSSWRPDRRWDLAVFAAALAVFGVTAVLVDAPGYMDAEYYYATGRELAAGRGLVEPFVWNFLADPTGVPTPSHAYWMPLASLVASGGMAVLGSSFRAAQILFLLIAAAIPVVTGRMAAAMGADRRTILLSCALAILPGFFLPYLLTSDTFGLYALIGGVALWQMAVVPSRPAAVRWLLVGVLIGLAHLTRADGLLLWVPAVVALRQGKGRLAGGLSTVVVGYLAVMLPWWIRNLAAFGSVLPPGVGRTLWLLDYDELFIYPATLLTPARWWSAGIGALLQARLEAAWANAQSILAVNGYVTLLPVIVVGGWVQRRQPLVRIGGAYAATLFVFMTFVFPFAGSRGGFFHSSAALMPLAWTLAAFGVDPVSRLAPRIGWEPGRVRTLLTAIAVLVAASLSLYVLAGKVGLLGGSGSFARDSRTYAAAWDRMEQAGDVPQVVGVVNPPGFSAVTGVSAVALPHGGVETLLEVAVRFGLEWIVLEADHPSGLDGLYTGASPVSWLGDPVRMKDPGGRDVLLFPVTGLGSP